jgi:hypothetical protein
MRAQEADIYQCFGKLTWILVLREIEEATVILSYYAVGPVGS